MPCGKKMASGGSVNKVKNKGSQAEVLPNRRALTQVTKGDPFQRSMNSYAKKTPLGLGIKAPSIFG